MFSDRIFPWEEALGQSLADDGLIGMVETLVAVECVAAQDGNPKGGEISCISRTHEGSHTLANGKRRMLGYVEEPIRPIALSGNHGAKAGSFHARQGTHACQQRVEKIGSLIRCLTHIPRGRQVDAHG